MTAWSFITRWGNSLLLLPTAAWIGVSLWAFGERPIAWRWIVSLGTAVLLVLASKIAFLGWGVGSRALDFTGISGHSTLAAAVLPMFAWWLVQDRAATTRVRAVCAAAAFAVVVGLSRVLLSAHSVSEVVAGLVLGLVVAWIAVPRGPGGGHRGSLRWLVVGLLLVAGTLSSVGDSEDAHGIVVRIALALSGRSQPFDRGML
jgi:membrane-associated phospholipid phosphatase